MPVQTVWTLKAKSVALLAAYALFLAAVFGGFTVFLVQREVAAVQERLQQTAELVAGDVDSHLEQGRQRLATVARLPGLVHGLQRLEDDHGDGYIPPWTTLHYLFFESATFTGGVFLLDQAGTVRWTEPPGLPWLGTSLVGEPAIAAMYRTVRPSVSPGLEADALLAAPHVIVGVPIVGEDGDAVGLLAGIVDLTASRFRGALRAVPTGGGRFVSVIDQAGRVIASSDPKQVFAQAATTPADDSHVARAGATLLQARWQVVAGEPHDTALAPVRQLRHDLLGIGAVLLLLATAAGSRVVHNTVGAVHRLTRSAEVMASGDLSKPVVVDERPVEFATLGRTFERMRTELRASQAALTQRLAEREELMRLKEEFLANISHELRTPLNVIFGYTEVLLDEETDVGRRDTLARIRAQSEQLLQLVRDLMTLSGLNAGRITLERCPVDVGQVTARVRALMEQSAQGRPVEAICECPGGLPALHTDPIRLEQVLVNLVTNAFKFTARGSVALRVRDARAEGRVVFEVADTGIGIPAHELPHIFDEFRQVDGSMSRRHGGIGLGLALVRRLVGLMGGEVTATSREGEGSTFTVTLPVTVAPGAAREEAA